jgi:hypothetical protein
MATTTTYSLEKPTVGGSENTWGTDWNNNADKIDDLLDGTTAIKPNLDEGLWEVGGVAVTATAAELNILDGVTASTAELNILDGVTATTAEINYLDGVTSNVQTQIDNFIAIPSGGIIMWSGSIASVPSGWYLCDGNNGTPDLRNRFVVGAGDTYAVDATGGSADAVVVAHTHTYSGSTNTTGAHTHTIEAPTPGASTLTFNKGSESGTPGTFSTSSAGNHSHTFSGTTASSGSSGTNANLPPYYALAYIMKA